MPTYGLGVLVNELAFYTALRIWRRDYRAIWAIYRGVGAALRGIFFDPAYRKRAYPIHG
jgi:hypothetical protein